MKKQFINLDDVPTKNDGECDWYFFEATTSDGYAVFVSTSNPENINVSENIFYYANDGIKEELGKVLNNSGVIKIGIYEEETFWIEEAIEELE